MVVIFSIIIVSNIKFFRENSWIFWWLDIVLLILIVGIHNYFRAQLVRLEDEQVVPFTYQGRLQISNANKRAKRLINNGAILGVLETKKKTENIYPIVFSKIVKKDERITCEWGYLKPEFVPRELFQEGKQLNFIDNGKKVCEGTIIKVYEEFRVE